MLEEKKPEMFEPLTPDERLQTGDGGKSPRSEKTPFIPVPEGAPKMQFKHPKYGTPSKTWEYRDSDNRLWGYVARFDFVTKVGTAGKEVLPVLFCLLSDGKQRWCSKGFPEPRPLYRLPDILTRPEALVVVCEGEKAADAAAELFPECVATTSMGGANAPHKTDWTPLRGRQVAISIDNDDAGRKFGDHVAELLREANAHPGTLHFPSNYVVRDGKVVLRNDEVPAGWDIADAMDVDGWTPELVATESKLGSEIGNAWFTNGWITKEEIEQFSSEQAMLKTQAKAVEAKREAARKQSFRVGPNGVEKFIDADGGGEWWQFCSTLEITAATRDIGGRDWGRLLTVVDRDGKRHTWAMPMELLAADGAVYRAELLSRGLELAPGRKARDALHDYISTFRVQERARCVARIGWHGSVFVLPDETFGDSSNERVLLQTATGGEHAFRVSGTLSDWQQRIACFAADNSRLLFAISAAFAAPLVGPCEAESGGFHYRGPSSIGKSTALAVAASAWGGGGVKGYIKQWRTTDNGLEAVAAAHCDALLCLDEMSQVDSKAAGAAAYMLANGAGKSRSSRTGEARAAAEWRTLFLSNGEISIADKLAEDGKGRKAAAGQQVRVIDIPADAGLGSGLFETLHGFSNAGALAQYLKAESLRHYGTAIRAFLTGVSMDHARIVAEVHKSQRAFVDRICPDSADGQVKRVATRFGLVAAAGELAIRMGILPWTEGHADWAAEICFAAWLDARGSTESVEETEGVAQVLAYLQTHGASRFEIWGNSLSPERVVNRAGWRKKGNQGRWEYFATRTAFHEMANGFDPKALAKTLIRLTLLVPDSDEKSSKSIAPPGYAKMRLYHFPRVGDPKENSSE